jgi:Lon protease-like protein
MLLFLTPAFGAGQVRPAASLPASIPLFPLPDATLFPNSTQPFHIFEPRYRAMIADALAGDSIIGMVTLQPGFESDYDGRPPVYEVGCAGVIVASEQLADGRYNILLKGITRFRILDEDQGHLYRLADVESIEEAPADVEVLSQRRKQLEAAVLSAFPGARLPDVESDEEMIDALALAVPLEPEERQRVLEAEGPLERAAALISFLRARGSSTI